MRALHTDLYQLTMAAGYFESGKVSDTAVFELFIRRLPANRPYLIAAGLQQAVEYLTELRFTSEQIDYLRSLPQFAHTSSAFWEYLRSFRFTGDLFAMPEGTPFFAGEPVAIVRAPLIEAQIPETYLLAAIGHQSMIAAKAARIVAAAETRQVVEFGARRAHGPEAGVCAGRAAYIAGCVGTSNVEAGFRYGIPVYGTSAHSWVLAFDQEIESFRRLQALLGTGTVYLIDTYDTVRGAKQAASLGRPLWGVRLDSGDLGALSKQVRLILDEAGLRDAKIMATSDLNEQRIAALIAEGVPIDTFGVGTELATSLDAPAVSAVYKLAELRSEGATRYVAKYSAEKRTYPGSKQVFRYADRDVIGHSNECAPAGTGGENAHVLLRPVILAGERVEPELSTSVIREYCLAAQRQISGEHRVEYSDKLLQLGERHRSERQS
jgi:nicotinate phosphoribosyltransferase